MELRTGPLVPRMLAIGPYGPVKCCCIIVAIIGVSDVRIIVTIAHILRWRGFGLRVGGSLGVALLVLPED